MGGVEWYWAVGNRTVHALTSVATGDVGGLDGVRRCGVFRRHALTSVATFGRKWMGDDAGWGRAGGSRTGHVFTNLATIRLVAACPDGAACGRFAGDDAGLFRPGAKFADGEAAD